VTEEGRRDARQDADQKQVSPSQENPSAPKPSRPQIRFEDDSVDLSENDRDDASALNSDGDI
jgi:hypothetical protein